MLCFSKVLCQQPAITMNTIREAGYDFIFSLKANVPNTPIQVYFGDGILKNYTIDSSLTVISHYLYGPQIIKIYGSNVIYLDCNYCNLSNLDDSNYNRRISIDLFA